MPLQLPRDAFSDDLVAVLAWMRVVGGARINLISHGPFQRGERIDKPDVGRCQETEQLFPYRALIRDVPVDDVAESDPGVVLQILAKTISLVGMIITRNSIPNPLILEGTLPRVAS